MLPVDTSVRIGHLVHRHIPYDLTIRYVSTYVIYRVIQEESAILWEMIVCVILRKNFCMNMGPILNGYGVMTT
jgi:hypothetical protein